jgi:signal transduction histidine kinase
VAVTTVAPLVALVWLGLRVLDQDRQLERQQARDRLERAADLTIAALQKQITSVEERLGAGASDWPPGAVAVTFSGDAVSVTPRQRVAFLPTLPSRSHPSDALFAEADDLLTHKHDPGSAIAILEPKARARDLPTRTGALLRLARAEEAAGQTNAAIRTYQHLSTIDDVWIGDAPASLVATYGECRLLEAHGRQPELLAAATQLRADLDAGRWPLLASVYWLYRDDARRWTKEATGRSTPSEALAAGVSALWERWHNMPAAAVAFRGRETIGVGGDSVTAIWRKSGDTLRALVATPDFVRTQWAIAAQEVAAAQGVALSFANPEGARATNSSVLRTPAQTELPWAVSVTNVNAASQLTEFGSRRRLLIAGFVLLVAMGLMAGAATVRAVSREFAVARLQTDFVSTVSHEFRTPLTTLRQFTDRLREHPRLETEERNVCYDAQSRATDRLTRLVESLLDFGRMQAGSRPYLLEPVDCADLVEHVISEFERGRHAEAAIQLRRNGPAPVRADREALSLAIWNIVDNAVKYSAPPAHVQIDVGREADRINVAVRDLGIGIPAEEQRSIFQKFQRGHDARTRGIRGTGLGLAIVDHIVAAHRGSISVHSTPGEGSTFTVTLPAE